jgi:3-hydroxyisobutyrate dehydrogenase-like beta-hydroxyacid dehydrogenase
MASSSGDDSSTKKNAQAVGFIGLGIMGQGMAACLVKEGVAGGTPTQPLTVWNRTPSKSVEFQQSHPDKTIVIASSAREVVETCGVTFCMLSTPEASRAVFDDPENGVLVGVSAGSSIVDCATLAEADMTRMNQAVVDKGGRFLEAPVSGSKVPAAQGALIFLCAGSQELLAETQPALAAMGKAVHNFGPAVGRGTRAKLVVNSLMGTMVAALGEGLALAESVDLDGQQLLEVISQGAIQSPVYALKGPKMLKKEHPANFPLQHAHKDMALAKAMAQEAGVEYSVMDSAEKLFRATREDDELNVAEDDFSAVFEKILKESTSQYAKKR